MNAEQKNSYLNVSITVNLGSTEAWEVCFPTCRHSVFAKLGSLSYAKETQQPVCGVAVWALSQGRLHRLHKGCGQPEWAWWHFDPFPPKPHTHTFNLTHQKKSGEMMRSSWGVFPQSHSGSQKWLKFYESSINEKTLGPTVLTSHRIFKD